MIARSFRRQSREFIEWTLRIPTAAGWVAIFAAGALGYVGALLVQAP